MKINNINRKTYINKNMSGYSNLYTCYNSVYDCFVENAEEYLCSYYNFLIKLLAIMLSVALYSRYQDFYAVSLIKKLNNIENSINTRYDSLLIKIDETTQNTLSTIVTSSLKKIIHPSIPGTVHFNPVPPITRSHRNCVHISSDLQTILDKNIPLATHEEIQYELISYVRQNCYCDNINYYTANSIIANILNVEEHTKFCLPIKKEDLIHLYYYHIKNI